jgi:hypothetical protein
MRRSKKDNAEAQRTLRSAEEETAHHRGQRAQRKTGEEDLGIPP